MAKTLVRINRKKWLRGGKSDSLLRNGSGAQCCLGYVCKVEGFTNDKICGVISPGSLNEKVDYLSNVNSNGYGFNTSIATEAMHVNDAPNITIKEREKKLKNIFKETKYKLEFFG